MKMMNIRTYNRVAKALEGAKFESEENMVLNIAKLFGNKDGEDYVWIEETAMDGLYQVYSNCYKSPHYLLIATDYDYTITNVEVRSE